MWKKFPESLNQECEVLPSMKTTLKQVCIHFILKTWQRYNIFFNTREQNVKKIVAIALLFSARHSYKHIYRQLT
jgi:hypothetical protein